MKKNKDDKPSAGICDKCSVLKMRNTGDGVNDPENPVLWCEKADKEIELLPHEDQLLYCKHFKQETAQQRTIRECMEREAVRNKPSPKITFESKMKVIKEQIELNNIIDDLTKFVDAGIKFVCKQKLEFAYLVYLDVNHRHAINSVKNIFRTFEF